VFQSAPDSKPQVLYRSDTPKAEEALLLAGGREQLAWAFSAPGNYRININAESTNADSTVGTSTSFSLAFRVMREGVREQASSASLTASKGSKAHGKGGHVLLFAIVVAIVATAAAIGVEAFNDAGAKPALHTKHVDLPVFILVFWGPRSLSGIGAEPARCLGVGATALRITLASYRDALLHAATNGHDVTAPDELPKRKTRFGGGDPKRVYDSGLRGIDPVGGRRGDPAV
jgi:hypothetical protein